MRNYELHLQKREGLLVRLAAGRSRQTKTPAGKPATRNTELRLRQQGEKL